MVIAQETYVVGDLEEEGLRAIKKRGREAIGSPALATVGRGSSGGVFVAARYRFGMGLTLWDSIGVSVEGRTVDVHLP